MDLISRELNIIGIKKCFITLQVRDKLAESKIIEDWIPKEDMKIDPPTLEVCRTARDVAGKDEPANVTAETTTTASESTTNAIKIETTKN